MRYRLLRLVQAGVLPEELRDVLRIEPYPLVEELLRCYRSCPETATSCAPYTAYCCRGGSPSNCAGWNEHQMPEGSFGFMVIAASLAQWMVVLWALTFLPSRKVETPAPLG